ncbi:CAP domain-containing protein [Streptomyces gilvosporeus]|uniref:CAP domain-containing protein n=1 Tax=Streptomyces gilvosporeus TaxID=553510 RepID=UPI001F354F8F|nr:CAP domain-containing protein [Streptomyces gilvosporeus]
MAAGGVAALTTVLGGGYGIARSLSGATPGDALTAADADQRSRAAAEPVRKARSDVSSTTPAPTPTPSRAPTATDRKNTARRQAATAASSSPRVTAAPGATADDGAGRTVPGADTPAGGSGGNSGSLARQVIAMVNAERAQKGCSPLAVDARLQAAAQRHSDDMAARNYYDHTSPDGVGPGDRITSAGYRWSTYGENIFKGPQDARTAMAGWMKSPGHRENILNCAFTQIGVGVNSAANGPWWTQDFAAH